LKGPPLCLALSEAQRGQRNAPIEILRKEAQAQLTAEGRLDETHAEDFIRRPLGMFGTGVNDQLINERALRMAQERAGIPERNRDTLAPGARQGVADTAILRALEKQNQLIERQTQLAEEAQKARAAPPMVAPAPNPNLRMGG
jgi:hypothetical protein